MKYIKEEKFKLVKCTNLDSEVKLSSGGGVIYFDFLDIFSANQVYFQLLKRIEYLDFYPMRLCHNNIYTYHLDSVTINRRVNPWFLKNVKNSRCGKYSKTRLESCGRALNFKHRLLISIDDPGKFIYIVRIFIDILNEQGFKVIKYEHDDKITLNSISFDNKGLRKYLIRTKKILNYKSKIVNGRV